ncbi:cysteine desulfurase family protein [Desulfitobacterium metallireducens]|uniref:cysteine desulfurase n=1 Tax=Desulfitobacterium metallireducens DSM 15288 TaxID=871968 RepID=W0E5M2_9FIRM|nr:aminotransferase class V-fold PLP-dependent enzyme [Desulfitobacterium metallireducens]AHF06057.1 cysteine desulfurase [Desulfitobacterium metallireducens DSM 15288]
MSLYLDYNASTPVDVRVLDTMTNAYKCFYGNPDSRTHDYGTNAHKQVEKAREQVASLLGIAKNEVIFTSGATESDNLAVLGLAEHGINTNKKHIITTAIEHKAILKPFKILKEQGFEVDFISPDESGRIDAQELLSKVRSDTLLVSVMHANNETGIIQPVQEIGQALCDTETYFHIDAAQSCGKLVDELKLLKYDLLSLTAHKMYGPQGIGALVLRTKKYKKPPIKPIMFGGDHESGLRPGTLPVALILGLGKACEIAEQEKAMNLEVYRTTKKQIMDAITSSGVEFEINGDPQHSMPNTLNISFLGVDSEALMLATKQYCSISNGSACTSHDYSHSHVLTAMGLSDECIESAIRISWGKGRFDISAFQKIMGTIKELV